MQAFPESCKLTNQKFISLCERVVWADAAVLRSTTVAVPAQDLEYRRKVVSDNPPIEVVGSELEFFTVLFSAALFVVESQERRIVFVTANT